MNLLVNAIDAIEERGKRKVQKADSGQITITTQLTTAETR
jgi:signal transduction histidine kinase